MRLLLPSLSDQGGGGGLCWMTLHFFLLGEVKLNENKFPTEIDNGKSLHFYPLRITRNTLHSFSTLFMSTAMQHPRWLSIFGFISKSCIYDYQNITQKVVEAGTCNRPWHYAFLFTLNKTTNLSVSKALYWCFSA